MSQYFHLYNQHKKRLSHCQYCWGDPSQKTDKTSWEAEELQVAYYGGPDSLDLAPVITSLIPFSVASQLSARPGASVTLAPGIPEERRLLLVMRGRLRGHSSLLHIFNIHCPGSIYFTASTHSSVRWGSYERQFLIIAHIKTSLVWSFPLIQRTTPVLNKSPVQVYNIDKN